MDNKKIISLFENKNIDQMFDAMERLSPHETDLFVRKLFSWIKENCDLSESDGSVVRYVKMQMTEEQHRRFKYLCSSERARRCIMEKDEKSITEQDMNDLRAADF